MMNMTKIFISNSIDFLFLFIKKFKHYSYLCWNALVEANSLSKARIVNVYKEDPMIQCVEYCLNIFLKLGFIFNILGRYYEDY